MSRVIIAGSRKYPLGTTWRDIEIMIDGVAAELPGAITEVVSGCAMGVDRCGEDWAKGQGIPVKHFPAGWEVHGNAAGPIRNRQMADYADVLIAIWDGKSRGTKNMIEEMEKRGKPTYVQYMGAKPC